MISGKIREYFEKYDHLKVLFFFDPDEQYIDEMGQWDEKEIHMEKYRENDFYLKIMFNEEWTDKKVVLYFNQNAPSSQPTYHDFPLLDLLKANRELRLDDISEFMESYQLQPHHRSLASKYMNELKYSKVQENLKPILHPSSFNKDNIIQGLFSSFLDFTKIVEWDVIIGKICILVLDSKQDHLARFIKKIEDNQLFDYLNDQLFLRFGKKFNSLSRDTITEMLQSLKYNQITEKLQEPESKNPYASLKINQPEVMGRLRSLHESNINYAPHRKLFHQSIEIGGTNIREETIVKIYGRQAKLSWYNQKLIIEVIVAWLPDIAAMPERALEGFSNLSYYSQNEKNLDGLIKFLIHSSDMLLRMKNIESFILDKPEDYFKKYTTDLYKIDTAYRKAINLYSNLDETQFSTLDLEELKINIDKKYQSYLDELNREWLKSFKTSGFNLHNLNVPKQFNFFNDFVLRKEQKAAVIISDGFRYEAGQELLGQLNADPKNQPEMSYMVTSIPSKTSIGMGNLLPGEKYEYINGDVLIDGQSSKTTQERGKII